MIDIRTEFNGKKKVEESKVRIMMTTLFQSRALGDREHLVSEAWGREWTG